MDDSVKDSSDRTCFKRRGKLGLAFWLPAIWIAFVAFCAVSADLWGLPEPDLMDWNNPAAAPGTKGNISILDQNGEEIDKPYIHLLGTDTLGRDIVSRLAYGARVSLAVGLISTVIGLVLGGIFGMLAGYYRGRLEAVIVGAMDAILAFPGLVLLLAITFYLGASVRNLIIALGILTIPAFCRVARANTLTFAEREFVQAARVLGERDIYILVREIMPNVFTPMIAYGLLVVAVLIVIEGALSFLGLGVPSPTPSWGGMIAEGREVLEEAPHVSMIPSSFIFLTVLSFNLIGDSLRGLGDAREGQL
jgi:peptide/nickel transport system permease protein